MSRPTEMTVRALLQKELEKRGVKVTPEISFVTPVGRMMPDLVLRNSGDYVVETKLGAEAKLIDALVRLYDYSKYSEAKGAFAILFPEQLRRPWPYEMLEKISADPKLSYKVAALFTDLRPTQQFAGNLSQIADWIAKHVLKPPVVEADTSLAIRALSDVVDYVTASTRQLGGKELEDIFGGEDVFDNLLQYKKGKYPLEEMRKAAVYLLINQILFYHILSNVDRYYVPIDETKINRPGDLAGYFRRVLEKDYSSTFGFDVASRLPDNATKMLRKAVMVIKALAPQKISQDVLGKVFHELIPFEIRKVVAAFYTNNEAAEILAQLAIDDPSAKVTDLAVGSGTLLVASYRRKKELLKKTRADFNFEDHKRFLEQDLTGIDIMPFAAHLAVVHLSLQALIFETERVRIGVWDSTELNPGQVIPAISKELKAAYKRPTLEMFMEGKLPIKERYVKKGAVTLEGVGGEEIPLEKADLVIMNPPFTRHERIPKSYKNKLVERFKQYSNYLHGQLGYYGYFILLADRFVKTGGRVALVLPATFLRLTSTENLRRLMFKNYHVEHIITTWQRAAFSEQAQFREILLIAKKVKSFKGNNPLSYKCAVTILKKLPKSLEEARKMAEEIKDFWSKGKVGHSYENDLIISRIYAQKMFIENIENLLPFIAYQNIESIDLWDKITKKGGRKLIELSDYVSRIKGDIKRGLELWKGSLAQYFFICHSESRAIKKKDVWIITTIEKGNIIARHKFLNQEVPIPIGSTRFSLRRAAGVRMMDVTKQLDRIVAKSFPDFEEFLKLSACEVKADMKAFNKYVNNRLTHFALVGRFDISAPGSRLLSFYSSTPMAPSQIMWSIKVPNEVAKYLSLWFNSSMYILQLFRERKETRGAFIQVLGYALKKILALDHNALSDDERKLLSQTFEKIREQEFPSILDQLKNRFSARILIDRAILRVLGFGDTEIDHILDYLYPALANEIEKLKTLMEG